MKSNASFAQVAVVWSILRWPIEDEPLEYRGVYPYTALPDLLLNLKNTFMQYFYKNNIEVIMQDIVAYVSPISVMFSTPLGLISTFKRNIYLAK